VTSKTTLKVRLLNYYSRMPIGTLVPWEVPALPENIKLDLKCLQVSINLIVEKFYNY
jgi:hypothetical protein